MTDAEKFSEERRLAYLAWVLRRYQARCATFAPWSPSRSAVPSAGNTTTTRGRDLDDLLARLEARAA